MLLCDICNDAQHGGECVEDHLMLRLLVLVFGVGVGAGGIWEV